MDDARVWRFEKDLWTGSVAAFRAGIDAACLMVVPFPPFVMDAQTAIDTVDDAPRWAQVSFEHGHIARPQENLIVIAYRATAQRNGDERYEAWCSSTYCRIAQEEWRLVQHQQTAPQEKGEG